MRTIAVVLLRGYRLFLSPLLHQGLFSIGGCRFSPTCSAYGLEAIRQYGLQVGFMLLMKRLLHCHPWGGGGYDPVPGQLERARGALRRAAENP